MTNDYRALDDLIGLSGVAEVAPPLLRQRSVRPRPAPRARPQPAGRTELSTPAVPAVSARPAPRIGANVTRPARASRPGAAARPTSAARPFSSAPSTATRPTFSGRGPSTVVRSSTSGRPLLQAVSGSTTVQREAESLGWVVTAIAWVVAALAAANAYFLLSTGGVLSTSLPFSGYVEYTPAVVAVVTWGDHIAAPIALSLVGALGVGGASFPTGGLRRVGARSGPVLFGALLAGLLGVAGTLLGLALVAFATAVGVAVVLAIGALIFGAIVALMIGLLSAS